MTKKILRNLACLPMAAASIGAMALPVTIGTPFMNLENRAVNSLGFTSGQFMRIGANSVTPNANGGTVGVGTTTDLVTGLAVTRAVNFDPGPSIPNFYATYFSNSASLLGPWTLKFSNGADSSQAVVSLPTGTTQAPFVNTITLSGTSANPTFSWAPPAGATVNGYRINIYDKTLVNTNANAGPLNNGQVASVNVAPTITSHTVTAADFITAGNGFQLNRNYSIEIGLIQTKDGTSVNLGNDNLKAISRVYADFQASNTAGPPVNLPVTLLNGSYQFNIAVKAGQTYYIDPTVAVGYDYKTGAGDPRFKSVVLPTGIGDGLYDIYSFSALGQAVLLAHDWAGGSVFDFAGLGVDEFRIGGIETFAGLDPLNATAFVTGLTFEEDGLFTGTQTPIVEVSAVPEPETFALVLFGLLATFVKTRRRQPARS